MDIATIVGLLAAFGLIFMAISENAPAFVDTASLLIVVAGSIAVVMARCSLGVPERNGCDGQGFFSQN